MTPYFSNSDNSQSICEASDFHELAALKLKLAALLPKPGFQYSHEQGFRDFDNACPRACKNQIEKHCPNGSKKPEKVNGRSVDSLEKESFLLDNEVKVSETIQKDLSYRATAEKKQSRSKKPTLECTYSRNRIHCETYTHVYTCKTGLSKIGEKVFATFNVDGERWIDQEIKRLPQTRKAWASAHVAVAYHLKEAVQKPQADEFRYAAEVGFLHGAFTHLLKRRGDFTN
uniref:Uncharacterized protein n=1 Tax=Lobelia laxa TaxID=2041130 RepID=A0A291EYR9_9ASTR|nr:hypothetical protein Lo_lxa1Pt0118 [Lobelia laxa]ATG25032.1 hypothetical protein Lo_lxa1Pt0118 [Lobelia laxa]